MCFDFNSASGCVEGQKAGFVPGSHCQKNGKKFIHVRSDYDLTANELRGKIHSRSSDHI